MQFCGVQNTNTQNDYLNQMLSFNFNWELGEIQQFISLTHKSLKGLLLVSLTTLAKLNFGQSYIFSLKPCEKCKQRYEMNQKIIKELITKARKFSVELMYHPNMFTLA